MYMDDMAFMIRFFNAIRRIFRDLQEWCTLNDMSLKIGPNKTAIVMFSNRINRPQITYEIPTTAEYKYLGN